MQFNDIALWTGFILGIGFLLALDMGVLNRKAHAPSLREAATWSAVWVSLAMLFAAGVFHQKGSGLGMQFLTGYIVELSLSADNVFLFAIIFKYFRVPVKYQHRVLFWGILSAIAMRGIMILAGIKLIEQFHWMIYVLGGFLVYTGVRMFVHRNEEPDISQNRLLDWLRARIRLTDKFDGQNFLTVIDGKRYATPLFLVLIMIELTDLIFALDSIPAIIGITQNSFVVFTSNILAILGLRSLYFLLARVMDMFHYLSVGLSVILAFVGTKMLVSAWHIKIPIHYSLATIAAILMVSVVASLIRARRERRHGSALEIPQENHA